MRFWLLLTLFLFVSPFSRVATASTHSDAEILMNRDREECGQEASQSYNWIIHNSDWRIVNNRCLQKRLATLGNRYRQAADDLMRREHECENAGIYSDGPTVDLSLIGLQIVAAYSAQELTNYSTRGNIESTLTLYYERVLELRHRLHALPHPHP